MALQDLELSLMAFPQSWNDSAKTLTVNLLLLPLGNPLKPLRPGADSPPQFAGTEIFVRAKIFSGTDLPTTASIPSVDRPFVASPPPAAAALFNSLLSKLPAGTVVHTDSALKVADTARIHKALPESYTNAIPFEKPQHEKYFTVGDGYGCALRAQDPGKLNPDRQGPPPQRISWGQIVSFILRQPALARAVGLIHTFHVPANAVDLEKGGWIYFSLDTSSASNPYVKDFISNSDTVKSYGAMIPAVVSATDRRVFTAQLFPLLAAPGSGFTQPLLEAAIYDDGFAQVVHCNQPETIDAATADNSQISPGAEAGIQIGWDDEQITLWLNRQIDLLSMRAGGPVLPTGEAPLGVHGYRVDVRQGTSGWRSLCKVNGLLAFNQSADDGSGTTPSGELWIEPAPIRSIAPDYIGPNDQQAWLPLYFAQWRGGSLVIHDDTMSKITPGAAPLKTNNLAADLSQVPGLRYGNEYQFRVRLVDLTGGGPEVNEAPLHEGLAAASTCAFRRHVAPSSLEVTAAPPAPAFPAPPEAVRTLTNFTVRKPRIGYPEALFAGVDPSQFSGANLQTLIDEATAAGRGMGAPDPDVDRFQVLIEARMPTHDGGESGTLAGQVDDNNFRVVYSLIQQFPADDPDPFVNLTLEYSELADISGVIPPADDTAVLSIPTARDIRIRMIPLCVERSNYYGTPLPPQGPPTDFIVRKESDGENDLFPFQPTSQLKAYYFQPGNNLLSMMASRLELEAQGLTLTAPEGTRVIFGASASLRHSLVPDGSGITFSNNAELLNHWIVSIVLDIQRDWTWNGFAEPAVQIYRDSLSSPIGTISYPHVVAASAVGGPNHSANRSLTRVIFFDGLQPLTDKDGFPDTLNPQYTVKALPRKAPDIQQTYHNLVLPITTPPKQTPKIVATGLVESQFKASDDYSETFPRDRYLWIEFDQSIADLKDDVYFARVLGYGPDPLLSSSVCPPNLVPVQQDAAINLDLEPMREIFAGQPADKAGLDAMVPLIAPDSSVGADGRHFLLPLPPGVSAEMLELFGFWTYEFRVGHQKKWSTAQGRYGRPLRVAGIQHPAPHLSCTVERSRSVTTITAPYATTVMNGVRVYDLRRGDPQTEIWIMLYAQVMQADGASHRNILLKHRSTQLVPEQQRHVPQAGAHTTSREPRGYTSFEQGEIESSLSGLGLPRNSPLSVLAVELLPGQIRFEGGRAGDGASESDPVGSQLGSRRILRTSNLTPVPAVC